MLRSTLIAPLDQWRRFELAVAVGIGEAIAEETGTTMQLGVLGILSGEPIIRCGQFAIFWQSTTELFAAPPLEPSEVRLEAIPAAYGMALGIDRPDLVIVDQKAGEIAAIIEVKYVAADTAAGRFREAVSQVVRYARGYSDPGSIDHLIRRSLIVLSIGSPDVLEYAPPTVGTVDFPAIREGALRKWVRARLLSQCH